VFSATKKLQHRHICSSLFSQEEESFSSLEMLQKVQNGSIARRNSKFAKTIVLVNEKTVILQQDNARPHKTTGTQQQLVVLG
jgi:hypothetical protein